MSATSALFTAFDDALSPGPWREEIAQANAARAKAQLALAVAEDERDEAIEDVQHLSAQRDDLLGELAAADIRLSRIEEEVAGYRADIEDLTAALHGTPLPPAALLALLRLRRRAMLDVVPVAGCTAPATPAAAPDAGAEPDEWTLLAVINRGQWVLWSHDYSHTLRVRDTCTAAQVGDDGRFTFGDDGDESILVDHDTGLTYALPAPAERVS